MIDFLLHVDDHLRSLIATYGVWTYAILFAIIFVETGIVIFPFLPGDSLLFAAGTFAAAPSAGGGGLNVVVLLVLLSAAAVLGDTVNYWLGRRLSARVQSGEPLPWLKREHLDRTHAFYEKYGAKTIVLARFVPIVRTFAPFVAGVGAMTYGTFLTYNVVGGVLWVSVCVLAGYLFGGLAVVQEHFELVIIAIVFVSVLPMAYEMWKHRRELGMARA